MLKFDMLSLAVTQTYQKLLLIKNVPFLVNHLVISRYCESTKNLFCTTVITATLVVVLEMEIKTTAMQPVLLFILNAN